MSKPFVGPDGMAIEPICLSSPAACAEPAPVTIANAAAATASLPPIDMPSPPCCFSSKRLAPALPVFAGAKASHLPVSCELLTRSAIRLHNASFWPSSQEQVWRPHDCALHASRAPMRCDFLVETQAPTGGRASVGCASGTSKKGEERAFLPLM